MLVRAKELGFYDDMRRYPPEASHPRAGEAFEMFDEDIQVDQGGYPVLPDWAEPVDPAVLTTVLRSPDVPVVPRAKERHPAAPMTAKEAVAPKRGPGRPKKAGQGSPTGNQQVI